MTRTLAVATAVVAALLAATAPAHAAKDDLTLISIPTLVSLSPPTMDSTAASISGDGRFIAFQSADEGLSDEDTGVSFDVFRRDTEAGTTVLISRASGTASPGSNLSATQPSISGDGRFVAFTSSSNNLNIDDNSGTGEDIYVRDTGLNATILVSRATGPAGTLGNGVSQGPAISADGRFVAFTSAATNLSTEDDDTVGTDDIFVRDLRDDTTRLVSRATGPTGVGADATSFGPSISADGRFVAFMSLADNLSEGDDNAALNVFVRDLTEGTTSLVGSGENPSISANGEHIAFSSGVDNLSEQDNDSVANVYVRNTLTGATTFVSRATGAVGTGGDGSSQLPRISGDGRFVAFVSSANNLSAEDNNAFINMFVRDLALGTTTYASRAGGAAGQPADDDSYAAGLSANGRFVAFESKANGLSLVDNDGTIDIFRRDLGDPPALPGAAPASPAAGVGTPSSTPIPGIPGASASRVRLSALLTAPSTKRCLSRRRITLRLKATQFISQLKVKVTRVEKTIIIRGRKLRAPIHLTGLPRGRYSVTITATLTDGTTQKVTKRYRTCTKR